MENPFHPFQKYSAFSDQQENVIVKEELKIPVIESFDKHKPLLSWQNKEI